MTSLSNSAPGRIRDGAAFGQPRPVWRFLQRVVSGVTWQGIAAVTAFSMLYGIMLNGGARPGGSVSSLVDYASGPATALAFFLPTYLIAVITAQFAPRQIASRALVLAVAVAAGVALGYALTGISQAGIVDWRGGGARHAAAVLPVLLTAWLGLAILLFAERERAAAEAIHDESERKLHLERRMSEARLSILQSQIEPHFLFNSLAHVRRLCRTNAQAGREMLRHLAHYLGAAQPALQQTSITLEADVDLAVAYLNIQQIRMGGRLRFGIDVADEARYARVPPMMLTTLVENAIKHGISPLEAGGEVKVSARTEEDAIVVDVADDGRGFQSTIGTGVGLANTRARLAILHGASASLTMSMNVPQGVVATIVLPREHSGALAG